MIAPILLDGWYHAWVPRKCEWLERVPAALEELGASEQPVVDRAGLETLLRVSPRQALRVMSRLPGAYIAGKSFLIPRVDLIRALESALRSEDAQHEVRRRERFRDTLDSARRELAARRVRIDAPADVLSRRFLELPAGIHLRPGELRIEFAGAEDLLRGLLEFSQAIMNDYETFERLAQKPSY